MDVGLDAVRIKGLELRDVRQGKAEQARATMAPAEALVYDIEQLKPNTMVE